MVCYGAATVVVAVIVVVVVVIVIVFVVAVVVVAVCPYSLIVSDVVFANEFKQRKSAFDTSVFLSHASRLLPLSHIERSGRFSWGERPF